MSVAALRLDSLRVEFDRNRVVHDLDLEVPQGHTLGILGPNGSGKSTLVRACLGIVSSSGTVELFGARLGTRAVDWARVGYAPQHITSTAGVPATALEVVKAGLLSGRRLRPGRGATEKAMAALDLVGLAHRANESVQTFSGGQQQRVHLARSLVRDPDILFLDEPFSGVDRPSREKITSVLSQHRDRGMTMVVVLHELQELGPLIDSTIVLEHGRIVHQGEPPAVHPHHDHPDHDHDHAHGADPLPYRTPMDEGTIS